MLMKNDIFRQTALLVAVVLLSTGFWSCSKDEKQDPEPSAVAVTGVTLKKTSISIQVDDKETLIATVLPEDATNKNISWKSDKPEIASVNANGRRGHHHRHYRGRQKKWSPLRTYFTTVVSMFLLPH